MVQRTVVVEAECSTEFGTLLTVYRKLRIQLKINIILTLFLMSASFSYHLGLAALLTTVVVCGFTLLYLVIKQQSMIKQMQKSPHRRVIDSVWGLNFGGTPF